MLPFHDLVHAHDVSVRGVDFAEPRELDGLGGVEVIVVEPSEVLHSEEAKLKNEGFLHRGARDEGGRERPGSRRGRLGVGTGQEGVCVRVIMVGNSAGEMGNRKK